MNGIADNMSCMSSEEMLEVPAGVNRQSGKLRFLH